MAKIKKVFIVGFLLLCIALQCLSFAACGGAGNSGDGEGVEPLGLYTDLQFSLHGENGQVQASVKNKFTLLPSTVTVNIELYRSDSFKESVADMTLAASNYIYDLDQGKTITATASTDGKQSYWKARAYYKVDNKPWQEAFSETVLFTADGIKTTVSSPVPEDKDYYISDFLQSTPYMETNFPYMYGDDNARIKILSRAIVLLDDKDLLSVKNMLGEVKLNLYDRNSEEIKPYMAGIYADPEYMLFLKYSDDKSVSIMIDDRFQNELGANLFVDYDDNGDYKCFKVTISAEVKKALIDWAKNKYETQINVNSSATEWVNLTDLMRGDVQTAQINIRLSLPYYGSEAKRLIFNINDKDLLTIKDLLNEEKIAPLDTDKKVYGAEASGYFNSAYKYCDYSLSIKFNDNSTLNIRVSDTYKSTLKVNLYVLYENNGNSQYFMGLISNETQEALINLSKSIYNQQLSDEVDKILNEISS